MDPVAFSGQGVEFWVKKTKISMPSVLWNSEANRRINCKYMPDFMSLYCMYPYTKKHTCNTVYLNVECSIHMYTMNIQKGRLQKKHRSGVLFLPPGRSRSCRPRLRVAAIRSMYFRILDRFQFVLGMFEGELCYWCYWQFNGMGPILPQLKRQRPDV